jgi:hypothetical protein
MLIEIVNFQFRQALFPRFKVKGMYLRRTFSSSRLVRLLGDLASAEVDVSRQDFAERLGLWLDVFDGITLHAAHQSIGMVDEQPLLDARLVRSVDLEEEFLRVRTALVKAIKSSSEFPGRGKRARTAVLEPEVFTETDAGYAPHHQRYVDQQRHMALRIDALRAHVRQTITKSTPQLGQLASFDAVLDQLLGAREQKLLSMVPVLLERRFENWRKTHQLGVDAAQQQNEPALSGQPGGWLDVFGKELEEVLLAELEVRLQPVAGLIEAFSHEVKKYQ